MSAERVAKRRMTHSLSFDGVNDLVTIGNDTSISASGAISIDIYLSFKDNSASSALVSKYDGTDGYVFGTDASGNLQYGSKLATVWDLKTSEIPSLNIPIRYTLTIDSSYISLYKNGVLLKQDASTNASIGTNASDLIVAYDSDWGAGHSKVDIYSLMVWKDIALTADQVSDLYLYNIVPTHYHNHPVTAGEGLVAEYFNSIDTDGAGTVLTDSVGTNNGTISGATWSTEVPIKEAVAIGDGTHALSFDGVNDVVEIFDAVADNYLTTNITTEVTLSARIKFKSNGTNKSFIRNNDNLLFYVNSADQLCGRVNIGGSLQSAFTVSTPLIPDKEYFVQYVVSDTVQSIYIDGALVKKGTIPSGVITLGTSWYLGRRPGGVEYYYGQLDNTKIFNTALTATEVYNLYHHNVVPEEGLVAEYFNYPDTDGAGTVLTDSVNTNDGTISGATWIPADEGRVAVPQDMPHVLRYTGGDTDNVDLGVSIDEITTNDVTVNITALLRDNGANDAPLFQGASSGGTRFYLIHRTGKPTSLTIGLSSWNAEIPKSVVLNTWAEYTMVLSGTTGYLYKDGILIATETGITVDLPTSDVVIGNNLSKNTSLFGEIKSTQIWSQALTPTEIYDLHHHNIIPETGLVGNWDRISDDGATLIDSVGGNNGTISGATRVTEPLALGKKPREAVVPYVGSVSFDGVDDDVVTDAFAASADGVSYHIRFQRLGDGSGGVPRIFKHGDQEVGIGNAGAGSIANSYLGIGAWTQIGNPIINGKWEDLVVTYDNTNAISYLNGVLISSEPRTISTTPAQFILGNYLGDASNIRISVARVIDKTLTTAEVETLTISDVLPSGVNLFVNLEAKTDVLSGSSWRDVSGNDNHGAITGATLSSEAPSKKRKVVDGNLVKNGDFSDYPYLVAVGTTHQRWIDGTAAGSVTKTPYRFYLLAIGGSGAASFDTATLYRGHPTLKLSTTATSSYVETYNDATSAYTNTGVSVKPSTTYRYSFWMKTNYVSGDATAGATVTFRACGADGTTTSNDFITTNVKTTTDWTQYTAEFTTNATTAFINIGPRIYGHQGTGTLIMDAWFSDIKLEEV